jgi:hypothetical protein
VQNRVADWSENMSQQVRIEGYAIVSADGMLADFNRKMPDGLKIDADVRFFKQGLDRAALVVHGRNSHEQQAARIGADG